MIIDHEPSLLKRTFNYVRDYPAEALLNVLFIAMLFDLDSTLEDLDDQLEANQ
jgi:hypothetical protein